MSTVKNITDGPRFLQAKSGQILIQPGDSVDCEMESADAEMAELSGWFEMSADKPAKAAEKPAAKNNFKG